MYLLKQHNYQRLNTIVQGTGFFSATFIILIFYFIIYNYLHPIITTLWKGLWKVIILSLWQYNGLLKANQLRSFFSYYKKISARTLLQEKNTVKYCKTNIIKRKKMYSLYFVK